MEIGADITWKIITAVIALTAAIMLAFKLGVEPVSGFGCKYSVSSQLDAINNNACDNNYFSFPKEGVLKIDDCVEYMFYEDGKMFIKYTDSDELNSESMQCPGTSNTVQYNGFLKDKKNVSPKYMKEYKLTLKEPGIVEFELPKLCKECKDVEKNAECSYCSLSGINIECYYDNILNSCYNINDEIECGVSAHCVGYCEAYCRIKEGKDYASSCNCVKISEDDSNRICKAGC